MKTLIHKEIRLILPAWIAAMFLAILPVWLFWPGQHGYFLQSPGASVYAPFAIGVLLLGLSSFGQELNFGTFSILLAQPIPRRRLWHVKTVVLAWALALAFVALLVSIRLRVESVIETLGSADWQSLLNQPKTGPLLQAMLAQPQTDALFDSLVIGGLCTLAAFASGLWTNLLFRNTSAAFWSALLVPLGLGVLPAQFFGGDIGEVASIVALTFYSVAGFLWARKFFLRVQDVQWTGGILALPAVFGARAGSRAHNREPWRALFRKEFQFQHVNLLIAGLLLLTHLLDIAIRRISMHYFYLHPGTAMIWESWPLLWLLMPLVVGGTAVAEERKLGTWQSFVCLPTTRRRQFVVKFALALALGVFFGAIMPAVVEAIGTLIGLPKNSYTFGVSMSLVSSGAWMWLAAAAGLTALAFYASTLTRSLLQALGLAVVLSVLTFLSISIIAQTSNRYVDGVALWGSRLAGYILWPVMILTLLRLVIGNFRHLDVGWKLWRRNAFALPASLFGALVLTTTIYHRAWELWMPVEPVHHYGNFVYSHGRPQTPVLVTSVSRMAAVLPDGRLWLRRRGLRMVEWPNHQYYARPFPQGTGAWRAGFVGGADWRDVAVTDQGCFAIKQNGSLWNLSEVRPEQPGAGSELKQIGKDHDWKSVSASGEHVVALAGNGTIWEWGTRSFLSGTNWSVQDISAPRQVGTGTNWVAVSDSIYRSIAAKNDGSIWRWGIMNVTITNASGTRSSQQTIVKQPEKWLSWTDWQPAKISFDGDTVTAVRSDGTLWIGGKEGYILFALRDGAKMRAAAREMVRWGDDSDWREVALVSWQTAAAIKRNGQLWDWKGGQTFSLVPTLASRYGDWLTLCPCGSGFLALTYRGNLCLWKNPNSYPPDPDALLLPSRIKAREIASLAR